MYQTSMSFSITYFFLFFFRLSPHMVYVAQISILSLNILVENV